jgi:hypothetical protein
VAYVREVSDYDFVDGRSIRMMVKLE